MELIILRYLLEHVDDAFTLDKVFRSEVVQ